MAKTRTDVLQGTLDLLILKTLALGPMHGWAIAKRIQELSREALSIQQGSLYPALYRLQDRGWIRSEKSESEQGRAIRLYELSPAGRRQLETETASWRMFSAAIERVLAAT